MFRTIRTPQHPRTEPQKETLQDDFLTEENLGVLITEISTSCLYGSRAGGKTKRLQGPEQAGGDSGAWTALGLLTTASLCLVSWTLFAAQPETSPLQLSVWHPEELRGSVPQKWPGAPLLQLLAPSSQFLALRVSEETGRLLPRRVQTALRCLLEEARCESGPALF